MKKRSARAMSPKRKDLSVRERVDLLKQFDELPKCNQRKAAEALGISQPLLCKLLKNRVSIETCEATNVNRKRRRSGKCRDVEKALLRWVEQARHQDVAINRSVLFEKAKQFAVILGQDGFNPTDGWLSRWKERHNVFFRRLHGENRKVDLDQVVAYNWESHVLPNLLQSYAPEDIFNTKEMGLCFRAVPAEHARNSAEKKCREWVTVLLTCNMSGTVKRQPLVIGKSKNPPSFRGVKNLPVNYTSNRNAWMTSTIFTDFLNKWDQELLREKKNIALVLDSCMAHPLNIRLENIKLIFLPSDKTTVTQPLHQGIIKTVKTLFRMDLHRKIVAGIEQGEGSAEEVAEEVSLLDAMHMLVHAWNCVKTDTIVTCFKTAGFTSSALDAEAIRDDSTVFLPVASMTRQAFEDWVAIDDNLPVTSEIIDVDIAEGILQDKSSEENLEEDGSEEVIRPSTQEAHVALVVLRKTLELRGGTAEDYNLYYRLQTKVLDLLRVG